MRTRFCDVNHVNHKSSCEIKTVLLQTAVIFGSQSNMKLESESRADTRRLVAILRCVVQYEVTRWYRTDLFLVLKFT